MTKNMQIKVKKEMRELEENDEEARKRIEARLEWHATLNPLLNFCYTFSLSGVEEQLQYLEKAKQDAIFKQAEVLYFEERKKEEREREAVEQRKKDNVEKAGILQYVTNVTCFLLK